MTYLDNFETFKGTSFNTTEANEVIKATTRVVKATVEAEERAVEAKVGAFANIRGQ